MNVQHQNTPLSICIPRVFAHISRKRILEIFQALNLGEIDRVDMVWRFPPNTQRDNSNNSSNKNDKFQRVFIHFHKWFDNENAIRARERLLSGKEIKVIYEDRWFWKASANRSTPTTPTTPTLQSHNSKS